MLNPRTNTTMAQLMTAPAWGAVIQLGSAWARSYAARGDLNVYSNGGWMGSLGSGCGTDNCKYGPEYQCTELAMRWAAIVWGEPDTWGQGVYAFDMWTMGPSLRVPLQQHPNGGSDAPQFGDLLIFDRAPYDSSGHVAVVRGVTTNQDGQRVVEIAEQNWNRDGGFNVSEDLPINGTTMPDRPWGSDGRSLHILGWLRPKTESPTNTPTPRPTNTSTPRPTATPTHTRVPTATRTSTPRPTNTPAATATRLPTLTPRPTYTPVPTNTPTIPAPGAWTLCAAEGGTCSFSGTQAVAFGADGHFAYGVFTGGISCATGPFGDPAPGASKNCYTSTTLTPPAPGPWTLCASEGGACSFSGTQAVAFGADGHFAYGVYTNGASCNTSFGDPAPGASKNCYTSTTLTPLAPGIWTPCATEGGNCGFSGTQAVAFGANGHFAYGVYSGGAPCNTSFGNPAPGTPKACYTSTTLTPPAPGIWTPCAGEGGTCSFSGTQAVAFGANGHFAYGVFTGSALCNTGFGDPVPGASKGCYTSTTLTPPAPGAWTLCATEGGNCGFSGTQAVAFGADGHFAYGVYTGGAPCNTGFGDPAPGTSKNCYTSTTLTPPAPGPWTLCASEGGACSFSGTQAVAFGADGHFAYGVYTGGASCNTGFGDPAPGTPKACYTSTTLPPAPTPTAGPTQSALAINSGGGAAGNFVADTDVTGGTTIYSTSNTIDTSGVTNPAPQAVYQTERSGSDFTYTIPGFRPNTSYLVRLHFAEFAFSGPGIRLFNVKINGQQVLTNFDIYAAAGGQNKAVVEPFLATADGSGAITIEYVNVVGGAKSSGIEVLSAPPLAINSGVGAMGRFVEDTDVTGGTTMYSTTNVIDTSGATNPAPQAVYQTERSGSNFTYTIPGLNPGASYTVRLHFAEWAFSSPGVRLFNVTINGQQALTNFDIYATAGGQNKAVVEQFTTTANSSGQIVISYTNVSGGAKSSGIEILPAS